MHRRWRQSRGLAEIVGTLMLVLIVVAAATAFSFFVASYEQQLTSQENATHLRNLEVVNVLSVTTTALRGGSTKFASMNITIGSGDINAMWIMDFLIDGNVVVSYNASIVETGYSTSVGVLLGDSNSTLEIPPLDQAVITLDLNPVTPEFSFLNASYGPTSQTFLELQYFTQRGSLFTTVYVPPTALAEVYYLEESTGPTTSVEVPVLDGTRSFQEGANATIIAWDWTVTNISTSHTFTDAGAQISLGNLSAVDTYSASLTVYNSIGLFGVSVTVTFLG